LTGKPASEHREEHAFAADRYDYDLWVLNPPRQQLYEVINRRTKAMFDAGLIAETKSLVERGYREAAPMRAVGYLQALQVVDGTMSEADAINDVAQATRHYAKRQLTWFKKEKGARHVTREEAASALLTSLP
jgi:tRNA dimethylallyltransferase